MPHVDLDYALGDSVSDDITTGDGDTRRAIRSRLESVENQLSYVRRVAQSRLDLARSELGQRTSGRARSDLADVIRRLPDVLAENVAPSGLSRHADTDLDPDPAFTAELDELVSPMQMLDVGQLSRRELRHIVVQLETFEAHLSVQRRIVQERITEVNDAIAHDYSY